MTLVDAYSALVVSPEQLASCRRAQSISEFLTALKRLWRLEQHSDDYVLRWLARCNQQLLPLDSEQLRAQWLPYGYQPKDQSVAWCLPQGAATEPFHDQYLERCRQEVLINQVIQPRTPLTSLLNASAAEPRPPAGFIFHLSRCGSTLVSGSLAELDAAAVLSESRLLTEVLLDQTLSAATKSRLLPTLIDLQGGLPAPRRTVVKWNAWDLVYWPLIRARFPLVPVLLIIRDPAEILASHARASGRHMAGDPRLAHLGDGFAMRPGETLVDFRLRVLRTLLEQMLTIAGQPGVTVVDYAAISINTIAEIASRFSLPLEQTSRLKVAARMKFHSKIPGQRFRPDGEQKRQTLDQQLRTRIREELLPLYAQLLRLSPPPLAASACG